MPILLRLLLALAWLLMPLLARADAASLLAKAQGEDAARHAALVALGADIRATSDNQAFTVWWQPTGWKPTSGVIVALHGHGAYATSEAYLWQPHADKRGLAVLALQWWFGGGEATSDYYRPDQLYPLISQMLMDKGVLPGTVLFTGFSRGSANSYAVAALDNTSTARRYFGLVLSNAGTAATGYPPNQQIAAGAFGSQPFAGMKWAMYCGEKDPDPTINGCPGMRDASDWVTRYGASMLLFIDDPAGDHGGFMTNAANVDTALATYAGVLASAQPALAGSETDCLLNWAEDSFPADLQPRRPPSLAAQPFRYRYYSGTRLYVGVSSGDHHLYLLNAGNQLSDLGLAAGWSRLARCR